MATTIEHEFVNNIENIWWEGSIWDRYNDFPRDNLTASERSVSRNCIKSLKKTDIKRFNYSFFKIRNPDDHKTDIYYNASNEEKQLNQIRFDDELTIRTCNTF